MKKRRFPLSLAILLPTTLAILAGLAGLYIGGYFVVRDSATNIAIENDRTDLGHLYDLTMEDQNVTLTSYALCPVIKCYEENKPAELPAPGSAEETEYKDLIAKSAMSYLGSQFASRIERFVTDFIGVFYEDTATNRMVLVYNSNDRIIVSDKMTALYLGAFFDRISLFDNADFYGELITDSNYGTMFASGMYLGTISEVNVQGAPARRIWIIRETSAEDVYGMGPLFTQNFAIISGTVLLVLPPLIYILLYFLVLRRIRRLSLEGTKFVESLNAGEPKPTIAPLNASISNELTDLYDSVYVTQEAIVDYAERIRESASYEERINAELALAERIQASMVPSEPLIGKGFLLRGYMQPAKEVGGDLYNYVQIDEDHVGFFIGDVSGKGVPAALFMARANSIMLMALKDFDVNGVNRILSSDNSELLFVTAFMATLELSTGKLRYVNAGHEPAFLYHDGHYSYLPEESNFMMGYIPDMDFAIQEITLAPGDRLFLYTDGVSEAMNEKGELFGKTRIQRCLNKAEGLPSAEVFSLMRKDMAEFVGGAEQSDDACMVALDYCDEATLCFELSQEGLSKVAPFVDEALEGRDFAFIAQMQVALDELCSNIVFYSESKNSARLTLRDDGSQIIGHLVDEGKPFDPTVDGDRERGEDEPGGHGLTLARSMLEGVRYARIGDSNVLFFSKKYR